ncbi:MAG: hypothetical protein IJ252_09380 [Solobacterium sp.]|nr:hypothetical protein [Solobacterium sp.]
MSETKQKNIFSSFPASFFNVLTGMNRELIQRSLSVLYERTSYGTSYTLTFDEACLLIEDILDNESFEVDSGEEKLTSNHERALFILRRLRSCEWITEEIGENYQRYLHFQDYAIEILQAVRKISSDESEEYSGYIFTIYQLLRSIDPINGDLALERCASNTEDLFRQLASLNTNIKKYIQLLMKDENKENLHALMEMLLEDYQSRIVDRAYYNLTTKDNPEKFREFILNRISVIRNDDMLVENMTRQKMERKGTGYDEAYRKIMDQLEYVESCFSTIGDLMDEINRKNNKYVSSALARITFLLEAHEDLEGKINRILKALMKGTLEPAALFQLYKTSYLDEESLYTMKRKRLRVKQSYAEEIEFDENALREFEELLAMEQRFSRQSVEAHMLELLKDRKQIDAGTMDLSDFEGFTFLVLGYLYGHDENSQIEIEDLDETVIKDGYRFRDFAVRRRADEQI